MKSLAKKSMLLVASLALLVGVTSVSPAMAGGDNELRIRVDKEFDGGFLGHGLGLHGLTGLGTLGIPSLSGFNSLGLGGLGLGGIHGLGLGGFGLGDRSIMSNQQITKNFSSVPSEFSITRIPGTAGLLGF